MHGGIGRRKRKGVRRMYDEATKMDIPVMVTIREAASKTGLSYDYLRKACLTQTITHIRCGNRYLINLEKLVKILNQDPGRRKRKPADMGESNPEMSKDM